MIISLQILLVVTFGFVSCDHNTSPYRDDHNFRWFPFPFWEHFQFNQFVGNFSSNPVYASQVNMWNFYTAVGLPAAYVNDIITLNISRQGTSQPYSYLFVETYFNSSSQSNATLLDFIFQVGSPNSTNFYDSGSANYTVTKSGDNLTFNFDITGGATVELMLHFDGSSGFTAKYTFANNGSTVYASRQFKRNGLSWQTWWSY